MRLKFGVCIPMGVIWRMCQFLPQQLSNVGVCISAHCWLSVLWRMCYIRLITDNPISTCPMTGLGVCRPAVVRNMAYVIHAP